MPKIQLLPLHEAHKIAAGEVVERPVNVIKELIENAIDAGATQITIHVQEAGAQSIMIADNGSGMSEEDAKLCVQQYATSKIRSVDELSTISTFGFRGEALASIAAVSNLTITTKEADSSQGIELIFHNGSLIKQSITPCNTGTIIRVDDLFYNVPARKKFLKKKETEWRQIVHLMQAFCFDYLSLHFKLFNDGYLALNCPPTNSLLTRVAQLWDERTAQSMIEINNHDEQLRIHGLISNTQSYKYDRSHQFFFVNKRWIKNHHLAKALMKGYLNVLPSERYPAAALFIDIDPSMVDINIHPRKEEVQFLHPRIVESTITQLIKHTLEQKVTDNVQGIVKMNAPVTQSLQFENQEPQRFVAASLDQKPFHKEIILQPNTITANVTRVHELPAALEPVIMQTIVEQSIDQATIIGHYAKTYILIEREDGLYFIDQHAAHERILYEQFTARFGSIESVNLIFPQVINVDRQEVALIEQSVSLLASHGITVDIFGDTQIVVQAIPVHAKNISLQEFIKTILGLLAENQPLDSADLHSLIHEKIHATMACKAAVKAGDSLTHEQMRHLIDQLAGCNNRFTCPHGRPTGWLLGLHELEKRFKRKV